MRAVLGIDAAWTLTQPSGVAVAAERREGWHLIAAASSYQRFRALADNRLRAEERPSGSLPDAPALLASASCFAAVRSTSSPLICLWLGRPSLGGAFPIMLFLGPTVAANAERITTIQGMRPN